MGVALGVSPFATGGGKILDREFGHGLQLFQHSVGDVGSVSSTITSNPPFISSNVETAAGD